MAAFNRPKLPAIPSVAPTTESMLAAINALKQAVEWLLGTSRGGDAVGRVFVQNQPPTAHTIGDLWITTQPTSSMSYWTGEKWQSFAVAHPDGSLHTSG
jgi:hypothetical protein